MKIGMIAPQLDEECGVAIYTDNLSKSLRKLGCKVVSIGRPGSLADIHVDFESLFLKKQLRQIVESEKIDVLHIQYNFVLFGKLHLNTGLLAALTLSKEIPVIVTLHEVQYPDGSLKTNVLRFVEKQIVAKSSAVITHTPQQADFLNKKNPKKNKNATCVFMGLKANGNIPKKEKNILFFGLIGEGKGVVDLVLAKDYLGDFNITIAGKPVSESYQRQVEFAAKDKDVTLKFEWISEEEKDNLYKWASIVVLPYRWAPYQSAVLHDALSYSLPVVVTKTGAIWELVEEFKLGEIVPAKNPEKLAAGIKKLYANYSKYSEGIKNYQNEADWAQVGKKTLEVYTKYQTKN